MGQFSVKISGPPGSVLSGNQHLIVSAKMNDVDPQAWLAHVLANIAQHPASRLDELLPWNQRPQAAVTSQAA